MPSTRPYISMSTHSQNIVVALDAEQARDHQQRQRLGERLVQIGAPGVGDAVDERGGELAHVGLQPRDRRRRETRQQQLAGRPGARADRSPSAAAAGRDRPAAPSRRAPRRTARRRGRPHRRPGSGSRPSSRPTPPLEDRAPARSSRRPLRTAGAWSGRCGRTRRRARRRTRPALRASWTATCADATARAAACPRADGRA